MTMYFCDKINWFHTLLIYSAAHFHIRSSFTSFVLNIMKLTFHFAIAPRPSSLKLDAEILWIIFLNGHLVI